MTQEALKLAIQLRDTASGYWTENEISIIAKLIEALAQRTEQEPVAVKRMKEWVEFLKRQSDNGQHMNIPSSFGAGTCWELAIELEQFINTIPPQRTEQEPVAWQDTRKTWVDVPLKNVLKEKRTWVELTDEDYFAVLEKLQNLYHRPPIAIFAKAIEQTLKEKNT
jgi:hypothetical protein